MWTVQCLLVDISGDMVQVIRVDSTHTYLGRNLPRNSSPTKYVDFAHRVQGFWGKFLKLPLTQSHVQKLGIAHRRMLRSVVGWVRSQDLLAKCHFTNEPQKLQQKTVQDRGFGK